MGKRVMPLMVAATAFIAILLLAAPAALATGWAVVPEDGYVDRVDRGDPWAATLYGGVVSKERMTTLLYKQHQATLETDTAFAGGSISRRIGQLGKGFSFELEGGAGYRFSNEDAGEVWGALFARYDRFPWSDKLYTSIAISTGLNYATRVSEIEYDDNNSKLLHYLAPEITVASPNHKNLEGVLRLHHRSGVFGVFNGVRSGTNVVTLGLRKRFDFDR